MYNAGSYQDKLCESLRGQYEILKLPFQMTVKELDREGAQKYFDWFISKIPARLNTLLKAIKSEDPVAAEKLDNSPESLVPLALWLSRHIHTLKRDPLETQREIEKLDPPLRADSDNVISEWRWSSETVSLCYDIGLYLAKTFQDKYENVKWTFLTEPKDLVYVNKPVLEGFRVHMSPYDIVLVCATKILRRKEGAENELNRIYQFWTGEHILNGQKTGVYVRNKERWTKD